MSTVSFKCSQCGARLEFGRSGVCGHCGTPFVVDPGFLAGGEAGPGGPTNAERIARIEASPEWRRRKFWSPIKVTGEEDLSLQVVAALLSGLAVLGVLVISSSRQETFQAFPKDLLWMMALLGAAGLFASSIAWTFRRAGRAGARIARLAAVVVERQHVVRPSGGGGEPSSSEVFVTLELREGKRRVLKVAAGVRNQPLTDQAGIVFHRGGELVHFHALAV